MNARSFKVIFSKRLGALVAVGENATSQGKSASGETSHSGASTLDALSSATQCTGMLKALCLATLIGALPKAFALDATALPTGADVRHGNATVGTEGATMTINQTTSRATINWQSFNVGTDARVNVVQNNSQSVLLNRVVGNEMSQIRGQISANGQVVLVNPNGIVMGSTGRITASAFTASTFGITDANFDAGKMKYERNGSTGQIVQQGHIQTAEAGGYVALIGADVNNQGTITTRQGAVVLAAADAVTLPGISAMNNVSVPLSRNVRLEINPAAFGPASVSNSGVIQTEGGQVLLRAAAVVDAISLVAQAKVTHNGTIDTSGVQGGGVDILADKGHVRVSGTVKANSTNGTAGGDIYIGRDQQTNVLAAVGDASGARLESKGGFVETSGKFLNVNGTRVMAKEWLLDPDNIDVTGDATAATAGYSKIKASDIVANLNNGTSVTIATSPTAGTSTNQPAYVGTSAPTGDGNILVNAVISKTSGDVASLTLLADNGITVNQEIKSTSNKLNVTMKANGSASGASSQGLLINKSIDANGGAINLEGKTTNSAAAVTVVQAAVIQGGSVTMVGNSTSGVAIKGTGKVNATAGGVSITGVGNTTGDYAITTNNTIDATGDILISTTSAALHGIAIREKVTSSGGKVDLYADVRTSGNGSAMNGNFAIKAKNDVTITGKSNGYYSVNGLGAIESTDGKVTIEATSSASSALRLTNTVKAKGNLLITGTAHNDSGINTGSTTTVTSTDGNIEFIGTTTGSGVGVNFTGTTNINATKGTFKVTAESKFSQGIVFQGNTNINAATYTIDAKALGGAAGIYHGSGNTTLTSTAGDSSIKGTSETGRGVFGFNGNINLNANNGSTTTFSSGKGEMRLGWGGGVAVNTNGNITLGSIDPGSVQTPFFSQADTAVNSGTLTIRGKSVGHGVAIQDGSGSSTDILVRNGSSLVIVGESTGSGSGIHLLPVGVANKIEMTGQNAGDQKGSIAMTGVSAAGVGISTGSTPITSDGGEIRLKGTGNGANGTGMNLNGLVQSVNRATGGKITIDANTLSLTGGLALVDAGSNGTVNIKTHNNNDILVGAADVRSATPANQKLGIDQTELHRITAGKLVIGDTASAGNISVSGAATTLAQTGNLTLQTGGSIAVNAALTAGDDPTTTTTVESTKNLTLDAGGAITSNASGKLTATDLILKAATTIGASGTGAIKTAVTRANLLSSGDQFLVEDNALAVSAQTTSNGNIHISTTSGTLNVGSFNGVAGIRAEGTGNISLTGNTANGHGLSLSSDITASNGNVTLSGTTSSSGTFDAPVSGVYSTATVSATTITMTATAAGGSGHVLGYHGRGGSFIASGSLTLSGTSDSNTGNGFYSYTGAMSADTGITITGTSDNGQGVGLDANVSLTNNSGDIVITGEAKGSNTQAMGLRGSSITNNGGSIRLVANKGNVFTNSVNGAGGNWGVFPPGQPLLNTLTSNGTGGVEIVAGTLTSDTGGIDGKAMTISQNGNGGVLVKTTGNGNVIAPKITNAGTGNVVIAAGSLKDPGDGSGGQVQTVSANTISQANTTPSKTYIYSGSAADTGALGNLDSTLGALKIDGTTGQNADTKVAYDSSSLGIAGSTALAQVLFREALAVDSTVLAATTLVETYGDSTTAATAATATLLAEAKAALKNNAANSGTNSTFTTGAENSNNRIVVSKSVVVDSLTGPSALTNGSNSLATSDFSTAGFLKAKQGAYKFADFTSDKYNVSGVDVGVDVKKREISLSGINAVDKAFDNSTVAPLAGVPTLDDRMPNDLVELSAPTTANFDNPLVGDNKPITVVASLIGDDKDNYTLVLPTNLTARITGAVEPVDPPGPVVQVPAPTPNNNTVVVAGGGNSFQLASAEAACSADTLNQCECETATNPEGIALEGIQICYEPNTRPLSAL